MRTRLLTRLSPVFPYTLLNYAYSLTRVSFGIYLLATLIGMVPGTVMYVYLGSAVGNLGKLFAGDYEGGVGQQILFYAGLAATVVVTVYVTHIARRALNQVVSQEGRGPGDTGRDQNGPPPEC